MKELLLTVIFSILFQGSKAAYCKQYTSSFYDSSYTYLRCPYGCCGTVYARYCCSSSYYTYTTYSYWSVGGIAGAAVGGIIGLVILIAIIVVIIKACTKSGTTGRVVQPIAAQQTPNVFVMSSNTGAQSHPPTQPGMPPPPPYTCAGMSNAGPAPVYPYPGQPSDHAMVPGKTS